MDKLCDDLRRWPERIRTALERNDSDRNSLAVEVWTEDSDLLLNRLRMIENAGPLADTIRNVLQGWQIVCLNSKSPEQGVDLCRGWAASVERHVSNAVEALEPQAADDGERGKATINARMLDLMLKNPDVRGRTARQWVAALGCGKSTIAEQPVGEELEQTRAMLKAERRNDRRRRSHGK